jgi:hypothetical protein
VETANEGMAFIMQEKQPNGKKKKKALGAHLE